MKKIIAALFVTLLAFGAWGRGGGGGGGGHGGGGGGHGSSGGSHGSSGGGRGSVGGGGHGASEEGGAHGSSPGGGRSFSPRPVTSFSRYGSHPVEVESQYRPLLWVWIYAHGSSVPHQQCQVYEREGDGCEGPDQELRDCKPLAGAANNGSLGR